MNKLGLILVVMVLFTGCDRGRSEVVSIAAPLAGQLAGETRDIWLRYKDTKVVDVPAAEYPHSVQQLRPMRVWARPEGLYIETYTQFVERAGIFVRHESSFQPPRNGDPGFEPVGGEIYWFYAPG